MRIVPLTHDDDSFSGWGKAVKVRPIIFSAPMIRALLDGRKTQTRRLAWLEPRDPSTHRIADSYQRPSLWQSAEPGDLLYVREAWRTNPERDAVSAASVHHNAPRRFEADDPNRPPDHLRLWGRLRPSIHMPRAASRLTLKVTAVKIERLQAMTSADAIREGIGPFANSVTIDCDTPDPVNAFADLWRSLHGSASWDANPEVVAISFSIIKANVDSLPSSREG